MDLNHENATNKLSTTKASARKTVWDSSTHMIFVELCLEEVKIGNRPASHFNKVGWTNLANNLKTRTGKDYTKLQLKNHWDSMKRDWKLYDHLMRIESGLGWDPVKKTINATSEWWDEKIQADPELTKFRGYLAPYKGNDVRYHIPNFRRGQTVAQCAPKGLKETFNYYHSSLRNVIERTFGVWKARWAILKDIHVNYSYETQVDIVIASMALG
ncbi:putative Myb/SANT-like domain, harbinger transposase-derived nuclease domain-containing protein [Helianthus annuus]|uniref:L10-interacting MYB domain-containing protein n=1 Tax=Helianthus annuus TaxID=4232 RepID=UPI000B8F051B|nr:L10-interacting MYB domain-containing protein [Helianthus annuus]KAJ0513348.1 putative Myb/SANT-like domain, harbinger transposase-derived nuclease domain-containing protein [Helianthus annuus]KAJ0521169.1 putative Myb/SANT-like domain, harbinger transposase-derived nuclease domain-containing protein [Helianthus annuus]KAJ0529463.1 putative Myb/SANT-like domain, harbinger transposase-derived nuclease domain-containing protein [Helianthus annuus]KAJ0696346.1 putative Myb/SANT-like domain, har